MPRELHSSKPSSHLLHPPWSFVRSGLCIVLKRTPACTRRRGPTLSKLARFKLTVTQAGTSLYFILSQFWESEESVSYLQVLTVACENCPSLVFRGGTFHSTLCYSIRHRWKPTMPRSVLSSSSTDEPFDRTFPSWSGGDCLLWLDRPRVSSIYGSDSKGRRVIIRN